jgi:hypothetical protein
MAINIALWKDKAGASTLRLITPTNAPLILVSRAGSEIACDVIAEATVREPCPDAIARCIADPAGDSRSTPRPENKALCATEP